MLLNPWNCSKFADKVRGTEKPRWATLEEWATWHSIARKAHPFRYWVAEDLLNYAEKAVYFVPNKINNFKHYVKMFYTDRRDILSSNGMLRRGVWYDLDVRLEVCIFESLSSFFDGEVLERDGGLVNFNSSYKELYQVYLWWKKAKESYWEDSDSKRAEIEENLIYVIKQRGRLWT